MVQLFLGTDRISKVVNSENIWIMVVYISIYFIMNKTQSLSVGALTEARVDNIHLLSSCLPLDYVFFFFTVGKGPSLLLYLIHRGVDSR